MSFGLHLTISFMHSRDLKKLAAIASKHLVKIAEDDSSVSSSQAGATWILAHLFSENVTEVGFNYPCPGYAFSTSIQHGNRISVLEILRPFIEEVVNTGESVNFLFNSETSHEVYWDFFQLDPASFKLNHTTARLKDMMQ